jgi:hypothetical protein
MAYVDVDLGVIKDARRRQRRRRSLIAALLLVAALGATIGWTHRHTATVPPVSRQTSAPPLPSVAPRVAFWHEPYMGVACRTPNSIACDRVGLAVWLRRPAVAVTASIAGTTLRLRTGPYSLSQWRYRPKRTGFTGYLHPAGLLTSFHVTPQPGTFTWFGESRPDPMIRFRIDFGHGNVVTTRQHVPLAAGWG